MTIDKDLLRRIYIILEGYNVQFWYFVDVYSIISITVFRIYPTLLKLSVSLKYKNNYLRNGYKWVPVMEEISRHVHILRYL